MAHTAKYLAKQLEKTIAAEVEKQVFERLGNAASKIEQLEQALAQTAQALEVMNTRTKLAEAKLAAIRDVLGGEQVEPAAQTTAPPAPQGDATAVRNMLIRQFHEKRLGGWVGIEQLAEALGVNTAKAYLRYSEWCTATGAQPVRHKSWRQVRKARTA